MRANSFAGQIVSVLRRDYAKPRPDAGLLEFAVIGAVHEYTPITADGLRLVLGYGVTDVLARLVDAGQVVAMGGPHACYRLTAREERDPRTAEKTGT
jgi:hypothetical protein